MNQACAVFSFSATLARIFTNSLLMISVFFARVAETYSKLISSLKAALSILGSKRLFGKSLLISTMSHSSPLYLEIWL